MNHLKSRRSIGADITRRAAAVGVLCLCLPAISGCSGTQTLAQRTRNFWNPRNDAVVTNDPALADQRTQSDEYKAASRGLENPRRTLLQYAMMKEENGLLAEARSRYREILLDDPDCLEARLGVARVEQASGRSTEARRILEDAAARNPNTMQAWLVLGRFFSETGDYEAAVESFTKATDIDSANQDARFELGLALARAGRLQDAQSHLEFAVGESAARFNIGYVLHEEGHAQEAASWFRQALQERPDSLTRARAEKMLAQMATPSGNTSLAARSAETPAARAPRIIGKPVVHEQHYAAGEDVPFSITRAAAGITDSNQSGTGIQQVSGNTRPQIQPAASSGGRRAFSEPAARPATGTRSEPAGIAPDSGVIPQWRGPSSGSGTSGTYQSSGYQVPEWRPTR